MATCSKKPTAADVLSDARAAAQVLGNGHPLDSAAALAERQVRAPSSIAGALEGTV